MVQAYTQTLNLPLITVTETETAYAEVDEIHFTLLIKSYAKEIQEVRNLNRGIAESVFKYLDEQKIPKRYIQTQRMILARNYIKHRQPREYDGFFASQTIYVCLKDINTYDSIVDALLQMDIEQVNGPIFKSSKYEETLKTARLKALKKARASAEEMASALGQKIGSAKLISNNNSGGNNSAYSSSSASGSNAQNRPASFEVGEIEIVAGVKVSFLLLD